VDVDVVKSGIGVLFILVRYKKEERVGHAPLGGLETGQHLFQGKD